MKDDTPLAPKDPAFSALLDAATSLRDAGECILAFLRRNPTPEPAPMEQAAAALQSTADSLTVFAQNLSVTATEPEPEPEPAAKPKATRKKRSKLWA